jgi:hypothetical protein
MKIHQPIAAIAVQNVESTEDWWARQFGRQPDADR